MQANALPGRLMRRALVLAGFACAAVALDPLAAAAQPAGFPREISEYRLTMGSLREFVTATENLQALEDQQVGMDDLEERLESMGEEMDLAGIAALFDSEPRVKSAINRAGMSSREYITFMLSLMQTMFGYAMVQMGGADALDQIDNRVLRDNIRFFMENEDEIEAITERLERLGDDG